jgi:ArsR family transcriptional regulator
MISSPLSRLVQAHKALGHPARLRILAMLRREELCACQITAILRLAPSTVSAHLKELRMAGLTEERKVGRWVKSRLSREPQTVALVESLWLELQDAPEVVSDAKLLEQLLRVDVAELCRSNLDLEEIGIAEGKQGAVGNRQGGIR